jgi:uncharacterized membrane protein YidH (DUF202 family)
VSGPVDRDPGLQPERTLLSWQRTLILLLLVGLLFMRGSLVPGSPHIPEIPLSVRGAVLVVTVAVAAALALHLRSRWRRFGRGTIDPETGRPPLYVASRWAMLAVCATVLLLCAVLIVGTVLSD